MTETLTDAPEKVHQLIEALREDGAGYKRIWRALKDLGYPYPRSHVQEYLAAQMRDVMSAIGDIEDEAQERSEEWFKKQGIELPPGFVAATVEVQTPTEDGGVKRHWLRAKPESKPEDRVEIRQAQPVVIEPPAHRDFQFIISSSWRTWIATPDAQIGFWMDFNGNFHSTHDERCFDIIHQVANAMADSEGLYGWIDLGDFNDLQAPSRHNPTRIDTSVHCLNKTFQRSAEEFARRRYAVGESGEIVVLFGNHDIRFGKKNAQEQPYLVGLRRPGEEDDYPVLTVPYLTRSKEYGVEWVPSYPEGYRKINSNLLAFHAPRYGSTALDTARKIAARVHASVIFGHTHRRESLAENIETTKGNRTMEVWSDGTFARIDGSLPSERNTFDERTGDRLLVGSLPNEKWGMLSENMHQGFSILHVEEGGRERFSVERVAIWDGWCHVRGTAFEASCDSEGNLLKVA